MKRIFVIIILFLPSIVFAESNINEKSLTQETNSKEIKKLNQKLQQAKKELTNFYQHYEKTNVENNKLLSEIIKQQKQTMLLTKKLESSNFMRDFIYPVLLSIIAALIFWLVFSFLPKRYRRIKIRNKLDLNMFQLYQKIFFILDLIMRARSTSPSSYQNKIRAGKLTLSDIELGLQNKCLNSNYLPDDLCNILIPIGSILGRLIKETDKIIERAFSFSSYLSPDEILLLEEVRSQLHTYDLELLGQMKPSPINPSLSFMAENINNLSKLYSRIQTTVFNSNFENRELFLNKIQCYSNSSPYEECIKHIERNKDKYPKDKPLLDFYLFSCTYMKGEFDLAYKKLNILLNSRPHIISYRSFFKENISDKTIKKIIDKYYSSDEVQELLSIIKYENDEEQEFTLSAIKLKDYYNKNIG